MDHENRARLREINSQIDEARADAQEVWGKFEEAKNPTRSCPRVALGDPGGKVSEPF